MSPGPPQPDRRPPSPPSSVALFAGCIAELATPAPAQAAIRVLEAMGTTVAFPEAQSCCGQPALNSGFPRASERLARHWLTTFEAYEAVVSPSGSCVAHLHHQVPRTLPGAWASRAADLAARTWEFSQFVAAYGEGLPLRLEATVCVHDSCHMLRSLGERTSVRRVLGRIEGLAIEEMTDPETCCGFGGTFAAKFPDVSVAMADAKLADGRGTGATWLVSADPGCLLHLQGRADWRGLPVRTRHLAEVVADALPTAVPLTQSAAT